MKNGNNSYDCVLYNIITKKNLARIFFFLSYICEICLAFIKAQCNGYNALDTDGIVPYNSDYM